MLVSANEVYQTSRKACLAAGLLHDRAEDIAEAVSWLQCVGLEGCSELENMLADHIACGRTEPDKPLRFKLDGPVLHIPNLRPPLEGVAAIDWILANPETGEICIDNLTYPLLFSGLLWQAGNIYKKQFEIHSGDFPDPVYLPDTAIQKIKQLKGLAANLRVRVKNTHQAFAQTPAGHSQVESQIWACLNERAAQTYVPETEESRLSGAGAGLVDND